MQLSFLLGPAGSGKTTRCLNEIRAELIGNPEGKPLIFLAPKQATFQLERQLLETGKIIGYSRLHILSFERLARFIYEAAVRPVPRFISEQGRTMVLHALLNRVEPHLLIFRGAVRRQGFSDELARHIREFINHGLTPQNLRLLAAQVPDRNGLRFKLHDFALLFEEYGKWMQERQFQDSDAFLGAAADLLQSSSKPIVEIAGLWVDGFAQLTPEERRLLVTTVRFAERSTLAFCVEPEKAARSPISPWYLVSQTVSKCKVELEVRYKQSCAIEVLSRGGTATRFNLSPALRHLEANWGRLEIPEATVPAGGAVRLYECADPEAEATCCAREILQFIRGGGRYREAAVLLRDFNNDYKDVLRRVFRRYRLPFFIDDRESVAHHPVAELTRGALRTIAFNWEQRDWFAVLKTGLIGLPPEELDQIENEGLARGWKGAVWRDGLKIAEDPSLERDLNARRKKIVAPFVELVARLEKRTDGPALRDALRSFWTALEVQEQMENWAEMSAEDALHKTVWEQMNTWLDDIALAFADQPLHLRQWIPILDTGLSSLSVGVIPPVLDEVLIGSVDRSRNPDLKLLFILGFNEKVFPAVPAQRTLLTEDDRTLLLSAGSDLAHFPAQQLAAEQFYGYIACTRARERLCVSYARAETTGKALNPSRFIAQLQRIFPLLEAVPWKPPARIEEVLHRCELPLLGILQEAYDLVVPDKEEKLSPETIATLYGDSLPVSVSALERFASCPFRFFVERGLKVHERSELLLDVREQGRFQHDVLARFHEEVTRDGRQWRDLTPKAARALIGEIADEMMATFNNGLFLLDEQNRFTGENYKATLQDFIEAVVSWFKTNHFDPALVEFEFGLKSGRPGWPVELSKGKRIVIHGRVDRIDIHREPGGEALCVIIDYKSGGVKPNRLLMHHGIQQQLTAYLVAITEVKEIAATLGCKELRPVGCFYVPLSARFDSIKTRREIEPDKPSAYLTAYPHNGLFNFEHLEQLDSEAEFERRSLFRYRLTSTGKRHGGDRNSLERAGFEAQLQHAKDLIHHLGDRIFAGDISIHPFKGAGETACKTCRLLPICRFDPWTQPYNRLSPVPKVSSKTDA